MQRMMSFRSSSRRITSKLKENPPTTGRTTNLKNFSGAKRLSLPRDREEKSAGADN